MIPHFCKSCLTRIDGKHEGYCADYVCQRNARLNVSRSLSGGGGVATKEALLTQTIPSLYRQIDNEPLHEQVRLSFRATLSALRERVLASPYDDATILYEQLKSFRRAVSAESARFCEVKPAEARDRAVKKIPAGDQITSEMMTRSNYNTAIGCPAPPVGRSFTFRRGDISLPYEGQPLGGSSTAEQIAIVLFLETEALMEITVQEFRPGIIDLVLTGAPLHRDAVRERLRNTCLPAWVEIGQVDCRFGTVVSKPALAPPREVSEKFREASEKFHEALERAFGAR